jgi:hypothetical protein
MNSYITRQISLKLRRRRAFSKLTKKAVTQDTSPQSSPKEREESVDTLSEEESEELI